MTPRRLEAIEEFVERLLQRSESPHPLESEEVGLVIENLRDLLDEIVSMSVTIADLKRPSRDEHRALIRQRGALLHRCREALSHLQRGEIDVASEILRAALMFDPRSNHQFPYRDHRDE